MNRVVPNVALWLLLFCPALPCAFAQHDAAVDGVVRDVHGAPQMGALVELLGPDAAVVAQAFTDDHGRYQLGSVAPGRYQLRASAAFLIPALRSNLSLTAGSHAVANLTMTAIFEVGAWFPVQKRSLNEPADDWRWTLRSTADRPLLRLHDDGQDPVMAEADRAPESSTQGFVTLSDEAGTFGEAGAHQSVAVDHGDGAGRTEVMMADITAGAIGDGETGIELNGGIERRSGFGGETRMMAGVASQPEVQNGDGSGLQRMTLASSEEMHLGDAVMVDAGTLLTAERLVASRASVAPFLRIAVAPTAGLTLMYRFASSRALQSSDDLDAVGIHPEVLSDAEGRPILLRDSHQEIAISRTTGKSAATLILYADHLPVAELQGGGRLTKEEAAGVPVVSDGAGALHFAASGYSSQGGSASWSESFTQGIAACISADLGSALARGDAPLRLVDLDTEVHKRLAPALSASVRGRIAQTGTTFRAQYRWQPAQMLDAVNAFNSAPEQAYLGVWVRQRLWSGRRLQGVNAVLEATNLLEEGYQPMVGPDGETLFLAQVPRTLQAGVSFSF